MWKSLKSSLLIQSALEVVLHISISSSIKMISLFSERKFYSTLDYNIKCIARYISVLVCQSTYYPGRSYST